MEKPPEGYSYALWAGLQGVRNMELRIVSNAHETSWHHEDEERAKFRRLTDEQESLQVLHLAIAESLFPERGEMLTTDSIRAILGRLDAMGYAVKRKL